MPDWRTQSRDRRYPPAESRPPHARGSQPIPGAAPSAQYAGATPAPRRTELPRANPARAGAGQRDGALQDRVGLMAEALQAALDRALAGRRTARSPAPNAESGANARETPPSRARATERGPDGQRRAQLPRPPMHFDLPWRKPAVLTAGGSATFTTNSMYSPNNINRTLPQANVGGGTSHTLGLEGDLGLRLNLSGAGPLVYPTFSNPGRIGYIRSNEWNTLDNPRVRGFIGDTDANLGLMFGRLEDGATPTKSFQADLLGQGVEAFGSGGEDASLWSVLGDVVSGRPGAGVQIGVAGPGFGFSASDKNPVLVEDDVVEALQEQGAQLAERARRRLRRPQGAPRPNRQR